MQDGEPAAPMSRASSRLSVARWKMAASRASEGVNAERGDRRSRRSFNANGEGGERDTKTGVLLESAALKARQKCAAFVSKNSRANNSRCARDYVPKIEAKVRRTWYTRRDQDGKTVLVQVEEGIDEDAMKGGRAQTKASFLAGPDERLSGATKSGDSTAAPADPFAQVVQQQHAFVHPLSPFMRLWETVVLLLVSAYFVVVAPLRVAFPHLWPSPGLVAVETLGSVLLASDTVLRFFVAFEQADHLDSDESERGKAMYSSANQDARLVVDRDRIIRRHLRGRFWVGCVSALPLDLIIFAASGAAWATAVDDEGIDFESLSSLPPAALSDASAAAYVGLLRLACVLHLKAFFDKWEWAAVMHSISDRVLKNLMVGAMGAHWLACGFTYIAREAEMRGEPSHLSAPRELEYYAQVQSVGEGALYARAIYWALTTMSGVGYGDITPITMGETVYAAVAVSLGSSFFLFTVGTVTSLISSADAVNAQVKARLAGLKKWMSRAGLPPEMRMRVLENFYDQHVTRMGIEDRSMLHELPKFLQHEVAMYLNKDIVSSTALFRGCSSTLVASIVEHLHAHRCLPLDLVVQKGEVADELYLIKRGLFEVLNDDGTVHRMLGPGSYFGEVALLCHVHRTMTVRAVTMGLVFVIHREQFNKIMAEYPTDLNQLLLSAALRYRNKAKPAYVVANARRASASSGPGALFGLGVESSSIFGRGQQRASLIAGSLGGGKGATMPKFDAGLSQQLVGTSRRLSQQGCGANSGREPSREREHSSGAGGGSGSGDGEGGSFKKRFKAGRLVSSEGFSRFRIRSRGSLDGGRRGSVDVGDARDKATSPLAFLPNAPIEALHQANRLVPVITSAADKLSERRDEEVVAQLRLAANELSNQTRASIDVSMSEGFDLGAGTGAYAGQHRKSTYMANRQKLQEALDNADEESSVVLVPRAAVGRDAVRDRRSEEEDTDLLDAYATKLGKDERAVALGPAPAPAAAARTKVGFLPAALASSTEASAPAPAGSATTGAEAAGGGKKLGWFEC